MTTTVTEPKSTFNLLQRPWVMLAGIILVLVVPVRLYLAGSAVMISRDGVNFIWYAQKLAEDPPAEMRKQAQHPLYPALILVTHRILESFGIERLNDPVVSWQFAAMAVTLIGGLTVILAVYVLARLLFDTKTALLAAAMTALAAEFCQHSADALTDMPHLAVYLLATACAIRGLLHRSLLWFVLAGLLSGIAYLFRPEGAEVAVVAAGLALLRRPWKPRQRMAACLAVSLAALLIASPYMLMTGKLVQKKSIQRFVPGYQLSAFSFQPRPPQGAAATVINSQLPGFKVVRAVGMIVEKWAKSLRYTFLLPALLWLLWRKQRPAELIGARLVAGLALLHLIILLALIFRFDYWELLSVRHVFILAGLTVPFSAAGIPAVLEWVPVKRRGVAGALVLGGLVAPTLPWMLETPYADDLYLRRAGEWIRSQGEGSRVLTTRHRVAFYANGSHVWSPLDADVEAILAEARRQKPDWLVFDERRLEKEDPDFFAKLEEAGGQALIGAHVETQTHGDEVERAIVYRYNISP